MKGADDKRIELTKEDEKVDIMTKDDIQVSAELAFSADFQESEGRHQSLTRVDTGQHLGSHCMTANTAATPTRFRKYE